MAGATLLAFFVLALLCLSLSGVWAGQDSIEAENHDGTASNEFGLFEPATKVRRLSRRACVVNRAASRKVLCDSVASSAAACSAKLDIGSANGRYAFLWSDGNTRLLDAGKSGVKTTVRWKLLAKPLLKATTGCSAYVTKFVKSGGAIQLLCAVKARSGSRLPQKIPTGLRRRSRSVTWAWSLLFRRKMRASSRSGRPTPRCPQATC